MIKHSSATPKYIQLAQSLEEQINSGAFKADERLYSESELCKKYDVSRITVRQALSLLESKDLIYTVHGKGTFVKIPMLSQNLTQIVSFSKMLSLKGLEGKTEIESFNVNVTSSKAKEALKLADYNKMCSLKLVASAQNSPVALYKSYFKEDFGEKMLDAAKQMEKLGLAFTTLDLYEKIGVKLGKAEQTLTAENLDKKTAELFGLPEQTALVVLESVFYDIDGNPLEYKTGKYRADIYSFKMTRTL